ncbi:MAG: hypothetical protein LBB16_01545 [Puniceicoccales bacterium]|nr:hypothetical protein [Puniceicoccales bacterium]
MRRSSAYAWCWRTAPATPSPTPAPIAAPASAAAVPPSIADPAAAPDPAPNSPSRKNMILPFSHIVYIPCQVSNILYIIGSGRGKKTTSGESMVP